MTNLNMQKAAGESISRVRDYRVAAGLNPVNMSDERIEVEDVPEGCLKLTERD